MEKKVPYSLVWNQTDFRKIEAIVVAIAVLHNIAIAHNESAFDMDDEHEGVEVYVANERANAGQNVVRNRLIDYFQTLL